jgi:hypothetical protein
MIACHKLEREGRAQGRESGLDVLAPGLIAWRLVVIEVTKRDVEVGTGSIQRRQARGRLRVGPVVSRSGEHCGRLDGAGFGGLLGSGRVRRGCVGLHRIQVRAARRCRNR